MYSEHDLFIEEVGRYINPAGLFVVCSHLSPVGVSTASTELNLSLSN